MGIIKETDAAKGEVQILHEDGKVLSCPGFNKKCELVEKNDAAKTTWKVKKVDDDSVPGMPTITFEDVDHATHFLHEGHDDEGVTVWHTGHGNEWNAVNATEID